MNKYVLSICVALGGLLASCSDDIDLVVPHATNITFSELEIPERFSHVIPDGGFSVEGINFNTVKSADGQLAGGFCYSNRSNRSFVWQDTPEAIDSIRYSVWTTRPNNTDVYLVCHVNEDDASFTFDKPSVIDYILVANTSWSYLAMYYGDTYAGEDGEPVANPNIPSKPMGIWHSFVPGGVTKFADGDYFTLTVIGYKGGTQTGTVDFDLACMAGHNTANPDWNYIVNNWRKLELSALGEVDQVVFHLDSSDKNGDVMRTPAWFCLDGFQLEQ